jgi:hypothetical protein
VRTRLRATTLRLVAAALVAVVSGVPQAARAALADDCCVERCESERDGRDCAPNCPSPSCLKAFPPAVPQSRSDVVVDLASPEPTAARIVAPVLPLVASGVFHPPRA